MSNKIKTQKQSEILQELNNRFGLDPERILFINERDENDPFIPAELLVSIARQHGGIKSVIENFDRFIPETNQYVYTASVVNEKDIVFARTGVATVNENEDIDAETLAAGRAISAALRDAGFHPYRSGSVVSLDAARQEINNRHSESVKTPLLQAADRRRKDLFQIHDIAKREGLISEYSDGTQDQTSYREFLQKEFGVFSAAELDEQQRARVINRLRNYKDKSAKQEQDLRDVA